MDKTIKVLSAILAIQLLAAFAVIGWSGLFEGPGEAPQFVDVDTSIIDEIIVSAPDGDPVVLRRVETSWLLPDYGNLPVDEDKSTDTIERLVNAKAAWPVATTDSAAERFEVTEDNHQRRVVLRAGERDLAEFYLGTSPGFRRVHARRAGAGDIFAIDFNNYELPTEADDWLDKKLLQPEGEITAIEAHDFRLTRQEDSWALESIAEGADTDGSEARSLATALKSLRVTGAADDAARARVEGSIPTFSYDVETDTGSYSYAFYQNEDDYLVKASSHAAYFSVAKYTGDRLNIDRERLVEDSEELAGNEREDDTSG